MIQRLAATPPVLLAAASAIMVVMVGTMLLGGLVAGAAYGLTLGSAVLIDASSEPTAEVVRHDAAGETTRTTSTPGVAS